MAYQLTLSPGQLIVVRAKNSTGWWLGELQVGHHILMGGKAKLSSDFSLYNLFSYL